MSAIARFLQASVAILLVASCGHQNPTFEECYFQRGWEERVRLARDFSPQLQMKLFLYGISRRSHSDTYVEEAMIESDRWREFIPLIVESLEEPVAWKERYHLLLFARRLTLVGHDLRGYSLLLESLGRAAETFVGNPFYLRLARESVDDVRRGPRRERRPTSEGSQ